MTVCRRMSHIITDKMYMKSVNLQADTLIMSELLAGFAHLQYLYSNEKILLTFGVTHANKIRCFNSKFKYLTIEVLR